MNEQLTMLGDITLDTFLKDYWQKKPVLIRQAFPDFISPLSGEELAGLALEDWVESRLVVEHGKTPWELRTGPFTEKDFAQLPESHWTLLVQAVDQIAPEVSEILDNFRFLPNWRLDDIMISYAVDQGSVGPHFDYYDVFLLQAEGTRTWKVGQHCDASSPKLDGTALNILREFKEEDQWTLMPGDMLYLPPQFAHWGIANGECMTYSIGFRAPSKADIINDFTAEYVSHLQNDERFTDANSRNLQHPGLITPTDIAQVQSILQQLAAEPELIASWFGQYMTLPKYETDNASDTLSDEQSNEELLKHYLETLDDDIEFISKALDARLAFYKLSETNAMLFANGETYTTDLPFAETISESNFFTVEQCRYIINSCSGNESLLLTLLEKGILYFLDNDDQ